MSKKADMGSKRLISLAPDAWVQWVTQRPDVVAGNILTPAFQWISRESDVLMQAYSPETGDFLVLNEVQLRYTKQMPRRIQAYAALAEEQYNLPVYPVLVNILRENEHAITNRHEQTFLGLQARRDYRVINLWEVDATLALQPALPSLLPFVPVLKGGGNETTIRDALWRLRSTSDMEDMETVLAFFASFVLKSELIQQIMRWDMSVLEQSPWYQEILRRGERLAEERFLQERQQAEQRLQQERQQAEQRFLQERQQAEQRLQQERQRAERLQQERQQAEQRLQQERQQAEQQNMLRILQFRFGPLPDPLTAHIRALSADQVTGLLEMVLAADSLETVAAQLPSPPAHASEHGDSGNGTSQAGE